MTPGFRCKCGHDHFEECPNCLCPEPHDELRMVETLMNGRWLLKLPSHRAYRPEWTTPPYWEEPRLAAMAECIARQGAQAARDSQPRPVVYDCGAEEGDMTGLFASWGADVVAIEANFDVWPNIRAIFDANGLNHRLTGCFVGFVGDELRNRPEWDAEYVGASGRTPWWPTCAYRPVISDHGFMNLNERPDCPVTTIDRLAEIYGPPTVITIDTEGSELTVLRGAYRTLVEHRPTVFVSVHQDLPHIDQWFPGDTGEKLAEYMRSLGYYGEDLALDHELHQMWTPED